MRLTTVAVVALLVCASFAPAAMALGESSADRPGTSASADLGDRAGVTLQTGETTTSTTTTTTTTSQSSETETSNDTNASDAALGHRVSSFVQSTSSETEGSVDSGMWAADVTRSNRPDAVDRRVTQLRERVSTLRAERAELRAAYKAGELSQLQYRSRLAELNGQLAALSTATQDTERAATRLNTHAPGLQRVREDIDAERRGNGLGVGRPTTTDPTDTADGNESTTDAPEPRRGEGNGNGGNGVEGNNRANGPGDDTRGNGDDDAADGVTVDTAVVGPLPAAV
ncbi:hypothetical protein SAMN04487949_1790 [Halogranum gelatinilyticum]|uniref:Uncharacterized protein n=1 Tax=Halogranum gelatinilyticum TaxID=660521 RepID=A0A1G9TIW4_9EURY|nr:hypothetical protein [Halogranum gelatinilyticum]SDM47600.1 hypothetical protein SAMN04487949_1790 [Halogranum gelatinilyticum]